MYNYPLRNATLRTVLVFTLAFGTAIGALIAVVPTAHAHTKETCSWVTEEVCEWINVPYPVKTCSWERVRRCTEIPHSHPPPPPPPPPSCTVTVTDRECGTVTYDCGSPTASCRSKRCPNDRTLYWWSTKSEPSCPQCRQTCGLAKVPHEYTCGGDSTCPTKYVDCGSERLPYTLGDPKPACTCKDCEDGQRRCLKGLRSTKAVCGRCGYGPNVIPIMGDCSPRTLWNGKVVTPRRTYCPTPRGRELFNQWCLNWEPKCEGGPGCPQNTTVPTATPSSLHGNSEPADPNPISHIPSVRSVGSGIVPSTPQAP